MVVVTVAMEIQNERYFERFCFITLVLFCGFMFWQFRPCGSDDLYIEKKAYSEQESTTGYAVRRMKTFLINMTADLARDAHRKLLSIWAFRRPYQVEYRCTLEFNAGDLVFTLRNRYAKMWKLYTRAHTKGDQLAAAELVKYLDKVTAWGREISELVDLFKHHPDSLVKPTTAKTLPPRGLRWNKGDSKRGRYTPSLRELGRSFTEATTRPKHKLVDKKQRLQPPTRPNNMYVTNRKGPAGGGGFELE